MQEVFHLWLRAKRELGPSTEPDKQAIGLSTAKSEKQNFPKTIMDWRKS